MFKEAGALASRGACESETCAIRIDLPVSPGFYGAGTGNAGGAAEGRLVEPRTAQPGCRSLLVFGAKPPRRIDARGVIDRVALGQLRTVCGGLGAYE